MKQLLFALKHAWGLALLLCGLLSCLAGVGYSAEDSIEKATPRHLVAVIPADLPPTYFLDKSGKAAGFSIDVMDQLAARLGLTIDYVTTQGWDEAIQLVLEGKANIIPSLTINEQRQEILAFTKTVDFLLINLVVASGNKTVQEIAPGLTIGVLQGSAPHNFLQKNKAIELKTFPNLQSMLFELLAGHVDGIVSLTDSIMKLAADAGIDDKIKVVGKPIIEAKRAIACRKGDTELVARFNTVIDTFVASPEYRQLYVKWYGKPNTFWTTLHVGEAMAGLAALLITIFLVWRFREKGLETCRLEQVNALQRASEGKYRILFDNAGDAIFIHNDKGVMLAVNPMACERLGYTEAELMALPTGAVDTPEERQFVPERVARLLEQGHYTFETVHQRKDGSPVPTEVNVRLITWEDEPALMSTCRDITERRQTAEALQENQRFLSELIENSGTLIFVKDREGRYELVNRKWEEVTGNKRETALGRTDHDLLPKASADEFRKNDLLVMELGRVVELEETLEDATGRRFFLSSKIPLRDKNNAVKSVCGVSAEITERKQAEEAIHHALQEKTVMLKEIHHRVKNNMQVVYSLLDLQAKGIADPAIRAKFEESRNRVMSMALIHENLYRADDLAYIDFNKYLQGLINGIAETYNRPEVAIVVDKEPLTLDINIGIPCGLIVNELVSNSFKYAFSEGRAGEIRLGISSNGAGDNVLTVADNGSGFPQGVDFRNTTSLGLKLVTRLTRQIHGTIELQSNEGTKFVITFPKK